MDPCLCAEDRAKKHEKHEAGPESEAIEGCTQSPCLGVAIIMAMLLDSEAVSSRLVTSDVDGSGQRVRK